LSIEHGNALKDGFVNALQFGKNGNFLAAGIGQEHKMGRWSKIEGAKNGICIIPLQNYMNEG
jgi:ribosomal RNA-processing protein 9